MPDQLVFQVTEQGTSQVISLLGQLAAAQQAVVNSQKSGIQTTQQYGQTVVQVNQAAQQGTGLVNQYGQAIGTTGQAAATAAGQHQQAATAVNAAGQAAGNAGTAAKNSGMAWVTLGAAVGNLPGPLGQVGAAFGSISVMTTRVQADVLALAAGLIEVGSMLGTAFAGTVQEAAQYERTFAEVKIVTQATGDEMKQLQEAAISLGQTSQFSSQQVAKGFYELGSAGLTAAESLKAIQPVTQAAMIGNLDLGKTTQATVGILRQFNLDASQTSHVVDIMTTAVQGSVLHWNDVLNIVGNLRGRATQMNVSLEESAAVLMLMSNAGVPATAASTALGTALDRLAKHNGEAAQGLAQLGVQTYDAQGKFVGLTAVLTQIEQKLPSMTEEQKNHALAMLGGSRAAGVFTQTLQQQQEVHTANGVETLRGTELLKYWTDQLRNSDGTAKAAADTIGQTLDASLKNLHGSVQEAGIRIGTVFIPEIKAATGVLRDLTNTFVAAPEVVQATVAALLAVGAVVTTVSGSILAFNVANVAMGGALAAAAAEALPIIAAVGAIGLAVAALAVTWSQNWFGMRDATVAASTEIQLAIKGIGSDLANLGPQLGAISSQIGTDVQGAIPIDVKLAATGVVSMVGWAAAGLGVQGPDLGPILEGMVTTYIAQALPGIGTFVIPVKTLIQAEAAHGREEAARQAKEIGDDFVANVASAILAQAPTLQAAWQQVDEALVKEFMGRGDTENAARMKAANYAAMLRDELVRRRPEILDAASHLDDAVADGLDDGQNKVINASQRMADSIAGALKNAKGNIQNAIGELAQAGATETGGNTNELAIQRLLTYENAIKAVNQALASWTPAERAHYQTMLDSVGVDERGAQATRILTEMRDQGKITQEQYTSAVERGNLGLETNAKKTKEAYDATKQLADGLEQASHAGEMRDVAEQIEAAKTAALGGAVAIRDHTEALAKQKEQALGGAVAIRDHTEQLERDKVAELGGAQAVQAHQDALQREHTEALGGEVAIRAHSEALEAEKVAALGGYAAMADHEAILQRNKAAALENQTVFADLAAQMQAYAKSTDALKVGMSLDFQSAVSATNKVLADLPNNIAATIKAEENLANKTGDLGLQYQALQDALHTAGLGYQDVNGIINNEKDALTDLNEALKRNNLVWESHRHTLQGVVQSYNDLINATAGYQRQITGGAAQVGGDFFAKAMGSQYASGTGQGGDNSYQIGANMAKGFRENVGSGPEEFGREIASGFRDSDLDHYFSSIADDFATSVSANLRGLANDTFERGLAANRGNFNPGVFSQNESVTASVMMGPDYHGPRPANLDQAMTWLRQSLTSQESANLSAASSAKNYGPTGQVGQFMNAETGQLEWQHWVQAVDGSIVETKKATDATTAATKATQNGTAATEQHTRVTFQSINAQASLMLVNGQAVGVVSRAMQAMSDMAVEASDTWAAATAKAKALLAGTMINAFGTTPVGLNYQQIYNPTATQTGAGGGSVSSSPGTTLQSGTYYGLPISSGSPITAGTLRGYADGGMIPETVMGRGLASGDPYLFHARETVVPAGGSSGGTFHFTFQVNAGLGADHILRQNGLWEDVLRNQIVPAAGRLGIRMG